MYGEILDYRRIANHCHRIGWNDAWFAADIFFLITGLASNSALLLLFLKERKSISASMVLGLNVVAMNLMYICTVPMTGLAMLPRTEWHVNETDTRLEDRIADTCSIFNTIGCPLLLTCMCVERYLAVVKPVLYIRVRKWEYRVAVSLAVWGVTLFFIVGTIALKSIGMILTSVTIIVICLFIIMLACLGGMIWSLMQKSPAHTTHANRGPESAVKRQAVYNVLIVVVPAVISYLPLLALVPLEIYFTIKGITPLDICNIYELSSLFPRFGVFIGPMFYFSKARQLCCVSRAGEKLDK